MSYEREEDAPGWVAQCGVPSAHARAQLRLTRDLRFLRQNPIDGVAAQPLENDLFVWHANFALRDDVLVHFELHFPQEYPSKPPSVLFATGFPHLNCFPKRASDGRHMFHLCLNMLGNEAAQERPGPEEPGSGWSSAYDAHGLLMQIQAFLLDERAARQRHNGMDLAEAIRRAREYACPHCPHSPDVASPTLEAPGAAAPPVASKTVIRRPLLCGVVPAVRPAKTPPAAVGQHPAWIPLPGPKKVEMPKPEQLLRAFRSLVVRGACLDARSAPAEPSEVVATGSRTLAAITIQRRARAISAQELLRALKLLKTSALMRTALQHVSLAHKEDETRMGILQARAAQERAEAEERARTCGLKLQELAKDVAGGAAGLLDRERRLLKEEQVELESQAARAAAAETGCVANLVAKLEKLRSGAVKGALDELQKRDRGLEKNLRQADKLVAMKEVGSRLLPEQQAKLERRGEIEEALHELRERSAALARVKACAWRSPDERLLRIGMQLARNDALRSHELAACEAQLQRALTRIQKETQQRRSLFGVERATLEARLLEAGRAGRAAEELASRTLAKRSLASGCVQEIFARVLASAVAQRRHLVDLIGQMDELVARKAAGKKLSRHQKDVLRWHAERVVELNAFEASSDAGAVEAFESHLALQQGRAEQERRLSSETLESLQKANPVQTLPEKQRKQARALAKSLRQIEEIAQKGEPTPEQRAKLGRRASLQAQLDDLDAEAKLAKAQAVAEAVERARLAAELSSIACSPAYVSALRDELAIETWALVQAQDARSAAQALVTACAEKGLCSQGLREVDANAVADTLLVSEAEARVRQRAAEQKEGIEKKRAAAADELLQQRAAAEASVAAVGEVQLMSAIEMELRAVEQEGFALAAAAASAEQAAAACRARLTWLGTPAARDDSELHLAVAAREQQELEEEMSALAEQMSAAALRNEARLAAFVRSHGKGARQAALAAWAEAQPAVRRLGREARPLTAWEAWRGGMGEECPHCAVLVPRQNASLHRAHCERARRFVPAGGATFLTKTPYQVLVHFLLPFLTHSELLVLSASGNQRLAEIVEDGHLWKEELHRLFPRSDLSPENMKDWKYAFLCEMNQVVADLRCFHSKTAFDDEGVVLGMPVFFTVNPKTRRTDYIQSHVELLSYDSFKLDGVRHTVWREEFTHWLPVYICEEHWRRALPLLKKNVLALLPSWQSTRFCPEMCLGVFCKAVNTLIVLLCDKGERFSEVAVRGFCLWHRWILRCLEEWPELQPVIEQRLGSFCKGEQFRSKEREPSVGEFIPLLLASRRFAWGDVVGHLLSEWLDRQVLWNCQEHPQLAETGGRDVLTPEQRVALSWSAKPVGRRLYAFHAIFLQIFKPSANLAAVAVRYDRFYGQPSRSCLRDAARGFAAVMAMESWPQLFKILRVACPSRERLAALLCKAVDNSVRRGYHKKGMDFNRVHASGVSKILKKGESYLGAADLKVVELQDHWAWHGETKFLDATCIVYDLAHRKLGHLDYQRMGCDFLAPSFRGVLTHSGDQMDEYKQSGMHTITMQLNRLPQEASYLYIVVSAWAGKRLSEIQQPNVRLVDQKSGGELCRYNVEAAKDASRHTAILMCVLHRREDRSTQGCVRWALEAIGDVGGGAADDYEPIFSMVEAFRRRRGF